jgi:hypothetical protein
MELIIAMTIVGTAIKTKRIFFLDNSKELF